MNILELQGVKKYYPVTKGIVLRKTVNWIKAVDCIDLSIGSGQTLGLVGESGCGKSTTARLILLLERPTSGTILFRGKNVQNFTLGEVKEFRACVQAVFQDPYDSLNPRMRVDEIVSEPILVSNSVARGLVKEKVAELLETVGLPSGSALLYPHAFSGGQKQRIAIARALSLRPALIILDEPVSALDVSIRGQIVNLLFDLQERFGLSYLLIAHDLATIAHLSTTIAVMYLGKIMEVLPPDELRQPEVHPYTRALLSAVLTVGHDEERPPLVISGEVPSALNPPLGCRFHTRCPYALPVCSEVEPPHKQIALDHWIACHLY